MKVAIIGCGQIADAHVQEAQKIPNVSVVAVCDLNKYLAKQLSLRFGIQGCYTEVQHMLQDAQPDVVHITTPPGSHFLLAKLCLENGAHVYIEKPFTINVNEAEEIVEIAHNEGRLVCVGHNSVYDPAYQRLLKMSNDGQLGKVTHLEATMGYNLDGPFGAVFMGDPSHWLHSLPGGLAQNNISHPISLILGMMPGNNICVKAYGYRFRPQRFHDYRDRFFDEIRAVLVSGDITANLVFTCRSRPVQTFIRAYGSKASVTASTDSRTLRLTCGANMPGPFAKVQWAARDAKEAMRELYFNIKGLAFARLHYFQGLGDLFSQFYEAIEGRQEMPIPMGEAVRVTRVMDAIIHECEINDIGFGSGESS
ncbi:Gfo/Idh/MocA family protein [Desulfosediminicola flagellatus]|uniref:Gfo/Idh/MocA family protein n=1 Tax=Desulfosediminicola flagellatus TaxID=2569541 RepID=UPI00142F23A2|nr:Gfo/Idh/MocA family oxidoreductase [Desulfosediminicola flagellatus]